MKTLRGHQVNCSFKRHLRLRMLFFGCRNSITSKPLLAQLCSATCTSCVHSRLISSSIRDNVLLGLPYKEKRYRKVLSACDLDLDIALLPAADLTEVGEGGMLLSGNFLLDSPKGKQSLLWLTLILGPRLLPIKSCSLFSALALKFQNGAASLTIAIT